MKRIYDAEHITQAHLLRALLEQQGISARVEGEYLQGGLGEIGVAGLVGISVAEHQVDEAKAIIASFETGQFPVDELPPIPDPAPESASESPRSHPLLLAVAGAIVVFFLYQLALLIWTP